MATDVEICSSALMLLGDAPIASLADTTPRAVICANIYQIAKRDILRSHPWNCAIRRVVLAPLSTAPVGGEWAAQFTLPGACLRVLDCGVYGEEDYLLEGNKILANTSTLVLRYVEDIAENVFDANLVCVMVKRMEMDLAYPITKSTSLMESLRQEFHARSVGVLAKAKTSDGQEYPSQTYGDSPVLAVRFGRPV